jgi:hypothetical protein
MTKIEQSKREAVLKAQKNDKNGNLEKKLWAYILNRTVFRGSILP